LSDGLVRDFAVARAAGRAGFRAALRFGVFAPAVLRPVFRLAWLARFRPAARRADTRAPEPVRFLDEVRF
jgi:hypothetical protein